MNWLITSCVVSITTAVTWQTWNNGDCVSKTVAQKSAVDESPVTTGCHGNPTAGSKPVLVLVGIWFLRHSVYPQPLPQYKANTHEGQCRRWHSKGGCQSRGTTVTQPPEYNETTTPSSICTPRQTEISRQPFARRIPHLAASVSTICCETSSAFRVHQENSKLQLNYTYQSGDTHSKLQLNYTYQSGDTHVTLHKHPEHSMQPY